MDVMSTAEPESKSCEVGIFPDNHVPINDPEIARKAVRPADRLEEPDDIKNTCSNAGFDDDVVAQLD